MQDDGVGGDAGDLGKMSRVVVMKIHEDDDEGGDADGGG